MALPKVEVVHIEGCQGAAAAVEAVKSVAQEIGIEIELRDVVVRTRAEAERHRHVGSPTVLVNGVDVEPGLKEGQYGLS